MLITFEGIDASGKTTQMNLLGETLKAKGFDFINTRQPGGTDIGLKIREILLNPEHSEMVPETEVLLYMADRIQHINQVIKPSLKAKKIVLCDRYHDATVAYQGGGRQLDLSWLEPLKMNLLLTPDLTLWFDISVEESQRRLNIRNKALNTENCRLEREDREFFDRIRKVYQKIAKEEPDRFIVISAENSIAAIQKEVESQVLSKLKGNYD
ncbi:dTMP kinase [bacterium]|nr:dTMP kinase [bacterium]